MSNLADEIMKKGRHDDRLSDLPDCVLLHILSFLHTKNAVRTCILSSRWNHLWKRIPTLILHSSDFSPLKSFDKFMSKILLLRDGSIALNAFDFVRKCNSEPPLLRKLANFVFSHSVQLQRLEISVNGDSSLVLPCISSCRALTSLKLSIYPKGRNTDGRTLFPKSLNLPSLTSLDLTNFAFCASDNAGGCAEPFSTFSSLNSLIMSFCTVIDAQILSISNATLVNLTMFFNSSDFTKIELSSPSLYSLTFNQVKQKLCGSSVSSVKQGNLDIRSCLPFEESPLVVLSWLLGLPNITSLTISASTLLVLSLIPDLLRVEFPSLCNLKSLKVRMNPFSSTAKSLPEAVMLKNKSRKEASKIKKAFKAGVEPAATISDRIVGFLCQNSPSAEVHFIRF